MSGERPPAEQVVVGVIVRAGRFLVQSRADDPVFAGCWEFPGGKCAPGEGHHVALTREIFEESGLPARVGDLLCALSHVYPDRRVSLHAYLCEPADPASAASSGEWVTPAAYRARPMPAANGPILDALEWTLAHPA
ncbi:MAG: (deoxy)nucleoside triphosphate pyrophosphohydrolase [Gemmatimonadota bacterium]